MIHYTSVAVPRGGVTSAELNNILGNEASRAPTVQESLTPTQLGPLEWIYQSRKEMTPVLYNKLYAGLSVLSPSNKGGMEAAVYRRMFQTLLRVLPWTVNPRSHEDV
jgi:hypothetical protein